MLGHRDMDGKGGFAQCDNAPGLMTYRSFCNRFITRRLGYGPDIAAIGLGRKASIKRRYPVLFFLQERSYCERVF